MKPWLWLYSEGYSFAEIAFQFEVSSDTVRNFILESGSESLSRQKTAKIMHLKRKIKEVITGKAFKVNTGLRPKKISKNRENSLIEDYLSRSKRVSEICEEYNIAPNTFYDILERRGMKKRDLNKSRPFICQMAEKIKRELIVSLKDEKKISFGVIAEVFDTSRQNIHRLYNEIKHTPAEKVREEKKAGRRSKYLKYYSTWKRLYEEENWSSCRIAKKYNTNPMTVLKALKKMGVKINKGRET